jgi:hypothetical protein
MDFKNRLREWGWVDSNNRNPKVRDLQSVEIQPTTILCNSYQSKIQYLMLKYLLLRVEKIC